MKKSKSLLAVTLILMLILSACVSGAAAEEGKIKIGVSFYALSGEYNTNLKNAMEAYYAANNLSDKVELSILDASSDANAQNSQMENLIASDVDAIILIAGDADAQAVVVEQAAGEGIPVIELCTMTSADEYRATFVGSDDIVAGRMLMEYLGNLVDGKGKMIILHGPTGISAEVNRHTGAAQIVEEKGWDIEIVAEKVCNWSRDEAMSAMENIITSGLDFDIVFAENDEMAVGALYALENTDLEYVIGGIDAIPDAVQAVAEGKMNCTFFQDAVTQAETALQVAIEAAEGKEIEKSYDIDFVLVTSENAADFM